jgi:ssDNA thymidine ADP-ribosyltransferase DarT-like protein
MPIPQPVRLFHITAIANLEAIWAPGVLLSKNAGATAGIDYQNIAHKGAQGARAVKAVPYPPGGTVHDFVPFYFAPRSPMLSAINSGKVENCSWRQPDIVHLETTIDRVVAAGAKFVFFDRNATLAYSVGYNDLAKLDAIAWDLFTEAPCLDGFCKYWLNKSDNPRYVDRMERRQAEFLAKDKVPLNCFTKLGVIDADQADKVRAVLAKHRVNLPVEVKRDWYFLGQ